MFHNISLLRKNTNVKCFIMKGFQLAFTAKETKIKTIYQITLINSCGGHHAISILRTFGLKINI